MKYPIMTLKNGTEITASGINEQGQTKIYVEKWNIEHDDFDSFEIILPNKYYYEC